MSHDTPGYSATPPSIRPFPTPEVLQGALVELEAAADLVEQMLVHGCDQAILSTVIEALDEMTTLLKGGR